MAGAARQAFDAIADELAMDDRQRAGELDAAFMDNLAPHAAEYAQWLRTEVEAVVVTIRELVNEFHMSLQQRNPPVPPAFDIDNDSAINILDNTVWSRIGYMQIPLVTIEHPLDGQHFQARSSARVCRVPPATLPFDDLHNGPSETVDDAITRAIRRRLNYVLLNIAPHYLDPAAVPLPPVRANALNPLSDPAHLRLHFTHVSQVQYWPDAYFALVLAPLSRNAVIDDMMNQVVALQTDFSREPDVDDLLPRNANWMQRAEHLVYFGDASIADVAQTIILDPRIFDVVIANVAINDPDRINRARRQSPARSRSPSESPPPGSPPSFSPGGSRGPSPGPGGGGGGVVLSEEELMELHARELEREQAQHVMEEAAQRLRDADSANMRMQGMLNVEVEQRRAAEERVDVATSELREAQRLLNVANLAVQQAEHQSRVAIAEAEQRTRVAVAEAEQRTRIGDAELERLNNVINAMLAAGAKLEETLALKNKTEIAARLEAERAALAVGTLEGQIAEKVQRNQDLERDLAREREECADRERICMERLELLQANLENCERLTKQWKNTEQHLGAQIESMQNDFLRLQRFIAGKKPDSDDKDFQVLQKEFRDLQKYLRDVSLTIAESENKITSSADHQVDEIQTLLVLDATGSHKTRIMQDARDLLLQYREYLERELQRHEAGLTRLRNSLSNLDSSYSPEQSVLKWYMYQPIRPRLVQAIPELERLIQKLRDTLVLNHEDDARVAARIDELQNLEAARANNTRRRRHRAAAAGPAQPAEFLPDEAGAEPAVEKPPGPPTSGTSSKFGTVRPDHLLFALANMFENKVNQCLIDFGSACDVVFEATLETGVTRMLKIEASLEERIVESILNGSMLTLDETEIWSAWFEEARVVLAKSLAPVHRKFVKLFEDISGNVRVAHALALMESPQRSDRDLVQVDALVQRMSEMFTEAVKQTIMKTGLNLREMMMKAKTTRDEQARPDQVISAVQIKLIQYWSTRASLHIQDACVELRSILDKHVAALIQLRVRATTKIRADSTDDDLVDVGSTIIVAAETDLQHDVVDTQASFNARMSDVIANALQDMLLNNPYVVGWRNHPRTQTLLNTTLTPVLTRLGEMYSSAAMECLRASVDSCRVDLAGKLLQSREDLKTALAEQQQQARDRCIAHVIAYVSSSAALSLPTTEELKTIGANSGTTESICLRVISHRLEVDGICSEIDFDAVRAHLPRSDAYNLALHRITEVWRQEIESPNFN